MSAPTIRLYPLATILSVTTWNERDALKEEDPT